MVQKIPFKGPLSTKVPSCHRSAPVAGRKTVDVNIDECRRCKPINPSLRFSVRISRGLGDIGGSFEGTVKISAGPVTAVLQPCQKFITA